MGLVQQRHEKQRKMPKISQFHGNPTENPQIKCQFCRNGTTIIIIKGRYFRKIETQIREIESFLCLEMEI